MYCVWPFAGASQAEWRDDSTSTSFQPECFRPWTSATQKWTHESREGPFRITVVNSFVGHTWRIQVLKTLLAIAETPEMSSKISELKVISTGTDVSAQIAAQDVN